MPSLRELADRALQRSGHDGTSDGTSLEHVEQVKSVFHAPFLVPWGVEQDLQQKTAKNAPCSTVPFSRDGTSGTSDLAKAIQDGVRSLQSLPCPRSVDPKAWRASIVDALRLARDGWAAKALALGWDPLDVFGAVPDRDGDPYADGLAVKIGGRKLLAITADYAVVEDVGGGRSYCTRREAEGAVLIWNLGRGR